MVVSEVKLSGRSGSIVIQSLFLSVEHGHAFLLHSVSMEESFDKAYLIDHKEPESQTEETR